MTLFLIGWAGFFGLHVFSAFRSRSEPKDIRKRWGEARYMGLYSLAALLLFVLMIVGYARAPESMPLWTGPDIARTLSIPLNTVALIVVIAAYVPAGYIKSGLKHPMMVGILLWALSHLWVGGDLAKVMLMGGFAAYAGLFLAVVRRRKAEPIKMVCRYVDSLPVGLGLAAAYAMMAFGHAALFGVAPI